MGTKQRTDKLESVKEYYIEFLRLPNPQARRAAKLPYATKQEFVSYWKVDRATVWRWEQDPEFMRRVHNDVLGIISVDDAQKIIQTMKIRAFDGNVQAAKFLLEWAGLAGAKASQPLAPSVDEQVKEVSGMSDEELQAFLAEEDMLELGGSEDAYDDEGTATE